MKLYDLAVVGGGPAGIASAVEATVLGLENVVLFEKGANHSTTIRTYYKDNKRVDKDWRGTKITLEGHVHFMDGTKESTLELFDAMIGASAIKTCFGTEIAEVLPNRPFEIRTTSGDLYLASSVVIAIGSMGKPNKPSYALPTTLQTRINFNIDSVGCNETILVVGGGDSAAEYAHFLSDCNAVTFTYRREKFTRVNPVNESIIKHHAGIGKIRLKLGIDINGLRDEGGLVAVDFSNGETEIYDRVVYALGGAMPLDFLRRCKIALADDGKAIYDENYQTNVAGLYVAGDIATRIGGSIAAGLNHAYKIISHIKAAKQ
ncbi:pyridine nucleotide-disulfide oxidoreductase [Campylobacterota bacterium]|nr:pyridine nucleotide-disulfide oxidoreductase [Campylobacterota bacterium]